MTISTSQVMPRLGGGVGAQLGTTSAADPNDPNYLVNRTDHDHIVFPGIDSACGYAVADVDAATAVTTATVLLRDEVVTRTDTEYIITHTGSGSARFHHSMTSTDTMTLILTKDGDGLGAALSVSAAGLRSKPALMWSIDWDYNGTDIPRFSALYADSVDVVDEFGELLWVVAGYFDTSEAIRRPAGATTTYLGHPSVVPIGGTVRSLTVTNDGVEVARLDASTVTLQNPAGAGYKARVVKAHSALLELSGLGDIIETGLPAPTVTADSGHLAGFQVIEGYQYVAGNTGRIFSCESANKVGFFTFGSGSSSGTFGVRFGGAGVGEYVQVALSSSDLDDGGRHAIAWRIGDKDGVRTLSARTEQQDWEHVAMSGASVPAPTLLSPRVGSKAYGIGDSHPFGNVDFGWTEKDISLEYLDDLITKFHAEAGALA